MKITDGRSLTGPGIVIFQDHRTDVSVNRRASFVGTRVVGRGQLGHWDAQLAGDFPNAIVWQTSTRRARSAARSQARQPAWSFVFPTRTRANTGETRTVAGPGSAVAFGGDAPLGKAGDPDGKGGNSFGEEEKAVFGFNPSAFQGGTIYGPTSTVTKDGKKYTTNIYQGAQSALLLFGPVGSVGGLPNRPDNRAVGIKGPIVDIFGNVIGGKSQQSDVAAWFAAGVPDRIIPTDIQPVRRNWNRDDRFPVLRSGAPQGWPAFPADWHGLLLGGTEETEQIEYFHPTDPRLVAPNFDGPHEMSSLVCDLDGGGAPSLSRHARISGFVRVVKNPENSPGHRNTLALQLGPSGKGDTRGGYVFDLDTNKKPRAVTASEREIFVAPDDLTGGDLTRVGGRERFVGSSPVQRTPIEGLPKGGTDKGILGMLSIHDGGPLDVGWAGDKHALGKDADGNIINPVHISTEAKYRNRRNANEDGPLDFSGTYIDGFDFEYVTRTYLAFDAASGKWRWWTTSALTEETDPDEPPDPPRKQPRYGNPPVPPDTPRNPPRRPTTPTRAIMGGRAVNETLLGQTTHRDVGFPVVSANPVLLQKGNVDIRYNPVGNGALIEEHNRTRPKTAQLVAYGAQGANPDGSPTWRYGVSQGRRTASGGFALLPAESDLAELPGPMTAVTEAHLIAGPGARIGAGTPDLPTGGVIDGWTFAVNGTDLEWTRHQSDGTAIVETTFLPGQGSPAWNVDQAGHGFALGQVVALQPGGAYVLAQANAPLTLASHMVSYNETNRFTAVHNGVMRWPSHGFPVGAMLYVSAGTPGAVGPTAPTAPGTWSHPWCRTLDADTVQIVDYRPAENP